MSFFICNTFKLLIDQVPSVVHVLGNHWLQKSMIFFLKHINSLIDKDSTKNEQYIYRIIYNLYTDELLQNKSNLLKISVNVQYSKKDETLILVRKGKIHSYWLDFVLKFGFKMQSYI